MLHLEHMCAGYEGLEIVHNITMNVPDGKIVSMIGANGVGKSTILKAVTGLNPPMSGDIWFDDRPIAKMNPAEICALGISMIPEGRQLFYNLTVEENLFVGSSLKKNRINRNRNKDYVYSIFPRLKEREKQLAGTLSGGEQQMVATARALMSDPKLLILDEPSWGLAPMLVEEIFSVMTGIVREKGVSVLLVEQNVARTLQISDWSYVIENGVISMQGVGAELLENSDLKRAYLGI